MFWTLATKVIRPFVIVATVIFLFIAMCFMPDDEEEE